MLLLFDIDGTLLSGAARAHGDALYAALCQVHGVTATQARRTLSPAGRTDGEIARAILLSAGVSAARIDERADAVRELCCQLYARRVPDDLSDMVVPGIRELLEWLSAHENVMLGLVTGNYEPIARLKLARAGIGAFFGPGIGGFGSDSEDRAALPAIARRRAGSRGSPYPREQTIVIGDTPRDISCAKADGLRCIAFAAGPFKPDELTGADVVAADTAALRDALTGLLTV